MVYNASYLLTQKIEEIERCEGIIKTSTNIYSSAQEFCFSTWSPHFQCIFAYDERPPCRSGKSVLAVAVPLFTILSNSVVVIEILFPLLVFLKPKQVKI